MTADLAATVAALGAAGAAGCARLDVYSARLHGALRGASAAVPARRRGSTSWSVAMTAGVVAVGLLWRGPAGLVVTGLGATCALGAVVARRRAATLETGLPDGALGAAGFALDLLAACLTAGLPVASALACTAAASPGNEPVAALLARASGALQLGAPLGEAVRGWSELPTLRAAGRVLLRTEGSGAAASTALRRIASRERELGRHRAAVRAREAAVTALAPITLCYLPAFMLVTVLPLGIGLYERLPLR